MEICLEICFITLVLYGVWLAFLLVKIWPQDGKPHASGACSSATILFAFRNEAKVLPALLDSLRKQDGFRPQILAIDDGSTDSSAQLVREAENEFPISLMRYVGPHGKRLALGTALKTVKTPYILQTDADCAMAPSWAQHSLGVITEKKADLAIFPIRFSQKKKGFWQDVLQTEFAAVMAVTCAMARAGKPVMCNGANLGYTQALWQEAAPNLEASPYTGGDDMFLMDYALQAGKPIAYCDAPEVWVETEPPSSLLAFFSQRRRWAAKWSGYSSPWPLAVALITLTGQIVFGASLVLLLVSGFSGLWVSALLLKILLEGLLLSRQLHKARLHFNSIAFIFWQVAYLPYLLAVSIPAVFSSKPVSWKSR